MLRRARAPIAIVAALLAAVQSPPDVAAQTAERPAILIVDRERALRESLPAQRLAEVERQERAALRAELDALRAELEAQEAEIAKLRETAPRSVFEERVKLFDTTVREARRTSQQKGEALQARFSAARTEIARALDPVLREVMLASNAFLVVDARNVLAARPGADVTEEVIRRFNAAAADLQPLPPTPEPD